VDIISAAANVVSLVSAAAPMARRGAIRREFQRCFEAALRRGLAVQNKDDRGSSASLVVAALPAGGAYQLLVSEDSPLVGAAQEAMWGPILAEHLSALNVLTDDVDIPQLARDTAGSLREEIERAARQPGNALFQLVVVAQLTSSSRTRNEPVRIGGVTNIWDLPLAPEPTARGESDEIESVLAESPVAVLSSGAGLGKSTLAWLAARRRADEGDPPLVWWMNASSRESLSASCDALLRALEIVPGNEALHQVRSLLSQHHRWFIVLDDVSDGDLVGAVIPSGAQPGSALATTRDRTLRSPGRMVSLGATDEVTMERIARSLLPSSAGTGQINAIVGACSGHPLVLATICRFVAATGVSTVELSEMLRTEPSTVLSETLGSHYPVSFAEVVARMLQSIDDVSSLQVVLAAAVGGGQQIPQSLLESALPLAASDIRKGMRRGSALGLIETGGSAVNCHAVVSDLILAALPDAASTVASRMLASIQAGASDSDGSELRQLAVIANAVSARVAEDAEGVVSTHLTLADALATRGLTLSAEEQIDVVKARLPEDASADLIGEVLVVEARVRLTGGDYATAIDVAEMGIRMGEDAQLIGVQAACLIVLAWCHENLGDRASALRNAEAAAVLVPDDQDVLALRARFGIPDRPSPEHVDGYLALAQDPAVGASLRALNFGLASRAATRLGQSGEAIAFARQALDLDRAQVSGRSVDIARDLNDLGMALLDAGELDEAETVLRESMGIYEGENPGHPMGVPPRINLGRLLVEKMSQSGAVDEAVLDEAMHLLEPALSVQQMQAPGSPDHAAVLVALADVLVFRDRERATRLLDEALQIDRTVYSDDHYEVGLDVLKLMSVDLLAGRPAEALRAFRIVRSALPEWEEAYPNIAVQLQCLQAEALIELGVLGGLPRIVRSLSQLAVDPRIPEALRPFVENAVTQIVSVIEDARMD